MEQSQHQVVKQPEASTAPVRITTKPASLGLLKLALSQVTTKAPEKKETLLAKMTHGLEDFASKYDGIFSETVWKIRDKAVNFAYEKLGIRPKKAYRVQTGIPIAKSEMTEDDLKKLSNIFRYQDSSFQKLVLSLAESLPKLPRGAGIKEPGLWFHVTKTYTSQIVRQETKPEEKDVFDAIKLAERNNFQFILESSVPEDSRIKRHLNINIGFNVGDIGNEMIINNSYFFPDNYNNLDLNQKIDFLKSKIKFIRNENTFRKPTEKDLELITRVAKFRYGTLEILNEVVKKIDTVNDPDELKNTGLELKTRIYELAISTGLVLVDDSPFEKTAENNSLVKLRGIRFLDGAYREDGISYYMHSASNLKKDMLSGKIIPDFVKEIDLEKEYELIISSKIAKTENIHSFKVLFKQGEVEIPAIMDVKHIRNCHPDIYGEEFSFRGLN